MSKSLSSWWTDQTGRRMGQSQSMAVRLALALTPVRSVIRVIDDTVPPLTVEWASEQQDDAGKVRSMSYTDFSSGRIAVNPLPVTEDKMRADQALDVVTGFAMHEASHARHSRDRFKDLIDVKESRFGTRVEKKEVPAFRPMRIAAYLWNLVEDVRIEGVTSKHWPGFAPYFGAVLDYMWKDVEVPAAGLAYGPKVADKLKIVWLACRYPGKVADVTSAPAEEIAWWSDWQADYLADRATTKETIQRGLDRLAEDEETKKELDQMAAAEKAEEARGERIRAQLDRLMREGVDGTFGFCVTRDGEVVPLDAETAAEVDKLVREELVEHQTIITHQGESRPPIRVRKPEETAESRRAYVGKPNADSQALRTALVFRPAAPQYDVKLLRDGRMDDEEVWRWAANDYRVFSERVIEAKPEVFLGMLVDLSGSMYGSKLKTAQNLAQLLSWALHDQDGVTTQVWGHTGDTDEMGSDVYRIWERGDPLSRLGLIASLPHSNNYDGHAISYCVREMRDMKQPQKVLIVLSDGLPSGSGYGGTPAQRHMRSVCRWAEKAGINVIQIAIDDDLRASDQSAMFGPGNWIGFKNTAALPRQLAKLMARFI